MKNFMPLFTLLIACLLIGSCGGGESDLDDRSTGNNIIVEDYPQFKEGERVEIFFTGEDGKKGQRGWWIEESKATITIRLIGTQESVIPKAQIQQLRKGWRGLGS